MPNAIHIKPLFFPLGNISLPVNTDVIYKVEEHSMLISEKAPTISGRLRLGSLGRVRPWPVSLTEQVGTMAR